MDFKKILDLISSSNINVEEVYALVNETSNLDLSKEDNQRQLITRACKIANKTLSKDEEDRLLVLIKEMGISQELFDYLK